LTPFSQNPITANPPAAHPAYRLCTIPLITDAACDGYDKVTTQAYTPPTRAECPGVIEKVVLQLDGSVKGTQYDRYVRHDALGRGFHGRVGRVSDAGLPQPHR
jgi:hypothetical protein